LCLTYTNSNQKRKSIEPISLTSYTKGKPNYFFLQNQRFQATVIGQLKLDIKTERITENFTSHNALIIDDYQFDKNTQLSLNWKVNGKPYQAIMNQSKHSINHIDFQTESANNISDMYLLFSSMPELGVKKKPNSEVSFKSIRLDQLLNENQLATYHSEWSQFIPIKLNTINGYTSVTDLQFKGLILRLSFWLIITYMIFWLFKVNGTHFIVNLFFAWLICSYFFLNNLIKQHDQINQAFPPEQRNINIVDQQALNLASLIDTKIQSIPELVTKSDKFVLIGTNTFFKLRLANHLSMFNIALNIDIQNLLNNQAGNDFVYLLTESHLYLCNKQPENGWLNQQVKFIYVDNSFCLLRKK